MAMLVAFEKIIYLDADTLIFGDLLEMMNIDMRPLLLLIRLLATLTEML